MKEKITLKDRANDCLTQTNEKKGITLVALVITIIILLILAGVAIAQLTGNGLMTKAKQSQEITLENTAKETMNLKITECQINTYTNKQRMANLEELATFLDKDKDEDIEYVDEVSRKTADISKINFSGLEAIFTKLKEYPYEFEIKNDLSIASIDGVKVASISNNAGGSSNFEESTIINDFEIEVELSGGTITISIKDEISTKDGSDVKGYHYFIENKVVKVSDNDQYMVKGLEANTHYSGIYVVAVDENGKLKRSSNTLDVTTPNSLILWDKDSKVAGKWQYRNETLNNSTSDIKISAYGDYDTVITIENIDFSIFSTVHVEAYIKRRATWGYFNFGNLNSDVNSLDRGVEQTVDVNRFVYRAGVNEDGLISVDLDITNYNGTDKFKFLTWDAEITINKVCLYR